MIDIDKQKLSQFVDQDGKIIVSDDMPEDLKSAIKFMNDNNVNLFENIPVNFIDDEDSSDEEENYDNVSAISYESDENEEESEVEFEDTDDLNDEADESSLQDLDNLF